jgi:hypothetical protein
VKQYFSLTANQPQPTYKQKKKKQSAEPGVHFATAKALFSWQNFWQNVIVALSLLFGN